MRWTRSGPRLRSRHHQMTTFYGTGGRVDTGSQRHACEAFSVDAFWLPLWRWCRCMSGQLCPLRMRHATKPGVISHPASRRPTPPGLGRDGRLRGGARPRDRCGLLRDRPVWTASTIKLAMVVDLLGKQRTSTRDAERFGQGRSSRVLRSSDDDAADTAQAPVRRCRSPSVQQRLSGVRRDRPRAAAGFSSTASRTGVSRRPRPRGS